MKIIVTRINSVESIRGHDIKIDCDVPTTYYSDILDEIWEEMGPEEFMAWVNKSLED